MITAEAPDLPPRDAEVSLREITKDTLRSILRLKTTPQQEQFVANNAVSVAQAHFEPENAWFRGIYAGETPVGFLMLWDDPQKSEYFLWRFMIDARYQRMGFGRRAIARLIEHVRTRPGAIELLVSATPGDGTPQPFYEGLGFVPTGEISDGEIVLRLAL